MAAAWEGEARRPVPLPRRPIDLILAGFFLANIPVVVLVETQVLFPAIFYPQALLDCVAWYVQLSGDYLVRDKPAFVRGLVWSEIAFQLPLLCANSYAFIAGKDWGRMTGIIYAAHTATTMFPLFADILASNVATRHLLVGIYLPYLIVPLIMLARLIPTAHPFTEQANVPKTKKGE